MDDFDTIAVGWAGVEGELIVAGSAVENGGEVAEIGVVDDLAALHGEFLRLGWIDLHPTESRHFAQLISAGHEIVELIIALCVGEGAWLAGIELAILVGVDVDGEAGQSRLIDVAHAVGVVVVPLDAADGGVAAFIGIEVDVDAVVADIGAVLGQEGDVVNLAASDGEIGDCAAGL